MLISNVRKILGNPRTQLRLIENRQLFIFRSFCSPKQHSLSVSYTSGLSPQSALSASRKLQFETPEGADSVLALLRNYGCTNTHISKIVSKYPALFTTDPEKTLLPKLEFFRSVGFSGPDIAVMVNENVVRVLRKTHWITVQSVQKAITPNIAILTEIGVPMSNILFLVTCHPNAVIQNREKFSTSVKKVIEMGFDPLKVSFLKAVQVICGMGESIWEQRMEVYKRWGLTDDEIMSMFRLDPLCMRSSEKKIMSVMDFLVNKMGWEPATIARYPTVFMRSLEKKIIPRCSVVKVLQMKGLVKKDLCLGILGCSENNFFDKFVLKYEQEVPELLNVYQGKIGILELGFVSEEIWEKKEL
ncbi:hypothetical protein CK203_063337 [Vitis vinifera]|uniref:Uncharacterized protein n=1 Tax=Vitis vinifera TaxID=29760 RepID=A0A438FP99_VITVI|nr:hypothetical protein CK203_063337 [Vitis vinifera]